MVLRSLLLPALLLSFAMAACTPTEVPPVEEEEEVLPPDDYPALSGVTALEDLDPAFDVAEYELSVDVSTQELTDGTSTEVWTYNGITPGPVLQARVGELVRVRVTNNLPQPTSIHWRGMRVPTDMDGVSGMGVYAIGSGETFTYEFTARDAGTFWYHSHVQPHVQVEAGLYGAFVVHEETALQPDVDGDRVFVFDDVLLDDEGQIAEPGMEHHVQMHGRSGGVLLVNGQEVEDAIHLAPGAVERWRIVNAANARSMTFRFPGLEVREIGSDGGLWRQSWTRDATQLFLPVGARAELEVRLAEGEDAGQMEMIVLALDAQNNVVEVEVEMVPVRLDDDAEPSSKEGHTADPAYDMPDVDAESAIDHTLELGQVQDADGQATWQVDGLSWPDYTVWVVDAGEVQVIELSNLFGMPYPMHLHGQLFTIVSRDGDAVDEPGLRDTVWLNGGEDVVIATDFSNPGYWLYHGSILEYAALGLQALVEVRE